jgi:UDP-N-acetyl-D-glucosamine dehydrogenase
VSLERALNDVKRPVKRSRLLILGASHKAGVGDTRESPALRSIDLLRDRGAIINHQDRYPGSG